MSEFISGAGVRHVFMLAGGGSMHLADSVGRNPALECVCCLHERACAFAAEAYAEYTNNLGVALVTIGPGGASTVTGLAAAWLESAPCLFLSGQVKRQDLIGTSGVRSMGPQEVDIVSIVGPITKYAKTVLDPRSIRYELEKAHWLATHGRRGPVWLDIPLDVQAALVRVEELEGYTPEEEAAAPPAKEVARAIQALNRAERPVLLLGNGARQAPRELLAQALDALRIPVLVTWKAIDLLPEDSPWYAGRPGAVGQRGANFTQQNSDCLVALGARLDRQQTAFDPANFAPAASKIVVDVDAAELDKLEMKIDVRVCADATAFLSELVRQSAKIEKRDRGWWLGQAREWHARYPVVLPEYRENGSGPVNSYVLVDALADELGPDDLLTPGSSGPCSEVFLQAFRVKAGQRVVNAPSLGSMGTGLPGSIGACIASGGRRTVCVNGDGGFQLNIHELETVRRLNLPIKFFILCNGGYTSIIATQRNFFESRLVGSEPGSRLTLPDVTRVAEAYGIPTMRIDNPGDLRAQVRAALDAPGPLVCAVRVSVDQLTIPRVKSAVRADGSMESKPMEDLWPFLDREEFQRNMTASPVAAE